jgi:hypothetical protein
MAQFKWLHEIDRPTLVVTYGPILQYKVPQKDGSTLTVLPADPVDGFETDETLADAGTPIDFTDERSLRCLRADPRVEEIV